MIRRVDTTEAEADFSTLLVEVIENHTQIIIEQEGQPIATLIGLDNEDTSTTTRPIGALALVGTGADRTDEEIDAMVAAIYARRDAD